MKLTFGQQRKLHKKLKVNASAENVFINMFMSDLKAIIGDKIRKAKSYEEVEEIINNIDVKSLRRYIKNLRNDVLKRNNSGFENVFMALTSGINQISQKRKYEKEFSKALPKLIKDKRIYEPLMRKFEENMSKIKNLPVEMYEELRKGYLQGKSFRGSLVEKALFERMGNRAKLIARTESAKVNTALTEVRSRAVGVKAYMWSTSDDQRVRSTHRLINNVMFFWDDKPSFLYKAKSGKISEMSGHCGELPNCRCVALPIFELDDIKFPVKIANHISVMNEYVGVDKTRTYISSGTIKVYNKQQFIEKYGSMFIENNNQKFLR